MKVTYLYHSGFAVETKKHFLIFDYWKTSPLNGKLSDGVINPDEIREKDVIVFSSHRHRDHFNDVILTWGKTIERIRFILSDDIGEFPNIKSIGPHESFNEQDFFVRTLKSNDEGVAFLLKIDGVCIYHAGDLNWWHWEGEEGSWNDDIKKSYQKEIDTLAGETIDLAFVPVDPRLKQQYVWGIDYILRNADVKKAVPMHFGSKKSAIEKLLTDPVTEPYRDKIVPLVKRGETAEI